MNQIRVKKIIVAGLCLFLVTSFQNCSQFESAKLDFASSSDSSNQFTCTNPDDLSGSENKRLSSTQIKNSLSSLFSASIDTNLQKIIDKLPNDGGAESFEGFSNIFSEEFLTAMSEISFAIPERIFAVTSERNRIFGTCSGSATITQVCVQAYLDGYASQVFRRPLSVEEKTTSLNVFTSSADTVEGLKNVLAYHLQSPQFLTLWELGDQDVTSNVFDLSSYEIANRISYYLADSPPDSTLRLKAQSGEILDPIVARAEIERVLNTTAAKTKLVSFFIYWLELSTDMDFSQLPTDVTSGITLSSGITTAAYDELSKYIKYVIFDQKGSYKDILTSKASFAQHSELAKIYGHAPQSGLTPVEMTSERMGIFHKLPFLYSGTQKTNLIKCGVIIRRDVLCDYLPTPSTAVIDMRNDEPLLDSERFAMSNRQVIEHQTKNVSCMTCHSTINPTGSAFENFDQLGKMRVREANYNASNVFIRDVNIDTQSVIPLWLGNDVASASSVDLITEISTSYKARACFAKKMYSYINQRKNKSNDDCRVNQVYQNLIDPDKSIYDALIEAVSVSSTKKRVVYE
jgi:hypothetical protein